MMNRTVRYEKRQSSFVDKDGNTRTKFTFFNMDNSKPRKPKKRAKYTKHGTLRSKYYLGQKDDF